jgi:hypothetical protein
MSQNNRNLYFTTPNLSFRFVQPTLPFTKAIQWCLFAPLQTSPHPLALFSQLPAKHYYPIYVHISQLASPTPLHVNSVCIFYFPMHITHPTRTLLTDFMALSRKTWRNVGIRNLAKRPVSLLFASLLPATRNSRSRYSTIPTLTWIMYLKLSSYRAVNTHRPSYNKTGKVHIT